MWQWFWSAGGRWISAVSQHVELFLSTGHLSSRFRIKKFSEAIRSRRIKKMVRFYGREILADCSFSVSFSHLLFISSSFSSSHSTCFWPDLTPDDADLYPNTSPRRWPARFVWSVRRTNTRCATIFSQSDVFIYLISSSSDSRSPTAQLVFNAGGRASILGTRLSPSGGQNEVIVVEVLSILGHVFLVKGCCVFSWIWHVICCIKDTQGSQMKEAATFFFCSGSKWVAL